MLSNKKVSIIVPVYNVEKYLDKCLNSIVNQSYKNIELIIVNDGSTDSSETIINKYIDKYDFIKSIKQKNQGLSGARNRGIELATGEYLMFIDSDDFVDNDMVEVLYQNITKTNSKMAVVNLCYYKDNSIIKKKKDTNDIKILDIIGAIKETYINSFFGPYAWNKMYHKSVFKEIRYPIGKKSEDRFIIHELINNAEKIVYINKTEYYYVQRANSITTATTSVNLDSIEANKVAMNYIIENYNEISNYAINNYILSNLVILNRIIKYSLNDKYKYEKKNIKKQILDNYSKIDFNILSSKDKFKIRIFKYFRPIYYIIVKLFK